MKIRENVLISELTTMRLGGAARFVIEIENEDDVVRAFEFAQEKSLPVFYLGGGANTIGHDEGFDGVIILNKIRGIDFDTENGRAIVGAGEKWDDLVARVCEAGWSGVEALSLIPGTVGAAPVQNIGAYGQEVATTIKSVKVFDPVEKVFRVFTKNECNFGYRRSIFNSGENAGRFLIVAVEFEFNKQTLEPPFYNSLQRFLDENNISEYTPAAIRRAVCAIRTEKLPDPAIQPSAGSFFKNVYLDDAEADAAEARGVKIWRKDGENKVNSGWLIEQAGLAGKVFHGFRVSEKAALVLINENAKSYTDLAAARAEIIDTVYSKFGYKLQQEPVEI